MNNNTSLPLRVAIIDDHPALRSGIRGWLSKWEHGLVVLEASDGLEYEKLVIEGAVVNIAIVDLSMPGRDGYEAVRNALLSGAHGVLSKSIGPDGLIAALEQVRVSGYCIDRDLMAELVKPEHGEVEATETPHPKIAAAITKREREFLDHLSAPDDPTYLTIAERMGLSKHTVETHRRNLFEKLGVCNRQGLFRAALNWKLLSSRR
jgi:DNA-binding NarL/FixJ family response regulator